MAYSTSSPPALIAGTIGGTYRLWLYKNTDAVSAVRVAGYITNGGALGMKAGDLLLYVKTDASPISTQMMIVSAISSGAADLSDGTAIVATNTD